jgi:hypothetical protein
MSCANVSWKNVMNVGKAVIRSEEGDQQGVLRRMVLEVVLGGGLAKSQHEHPGCFMDCCTSDGIWKRSFMALKEKA